jgi:hypothetical protein
MSEMTPDEAKVAARGRRTVLLIAAACLAPVIASYAVYYLYPRSAQVNYGTLLPTGPAPSIQGSRDDGAPFRLEDLRGRWVLLAAGAAGCDAGCERMLYATRQAHTMQGKERERVVRVWLDTGTAAAPAQLLAEHPGLIAAHVTPQAVAGLPGTRPGIWLIDPLGNLVLAYSADPDIKGLAKDLSRVLRASMIG